MKATPGQLDNWRFLTGKFGTSPGVMHGAFIIPAEKAFGTSLKVISSGREDRLFEHVSVSTATRCPTWEEMVMQLHPPKSAYVNDHRFCLHLWKPRTKAIPAPPIDAV